VSVETLDLGLAPRCSVATSLTVRVDGRLADAARDVIVTRDQVRFAKPEPDLFLTAAERLGVEIERASVVGDSVWDMLAGRRARALGIGLLSGGYGQEELERAGAYRVYEDPADNHIDEVAGRGPNHAARSGAPQSCRPPEPTLESLEGEESAMLRVRPSWRAGTISRIVMLTSGFWYYVINSPLEASGANQLKNACEHGSYWIYVTDVSSGAYNHIWIYDHLD
jgi:hypothetical protein